MNGFQQAARFNDDGIMLLASGTWKEAMRAFELALEHIQMIVNSTNLPKFPQAHDFTSYSLTLNCMVTNRTEISKLQNDGVYIYNYALRFTPCTKVYQEDLAFYTSVILFNIAVATHVESKTDGNDRCLLTRALKIYQMSFNMVDEAAIFSDDAKHLMVVILNNVSQIHGDLCAFDEQKQVLGMLLDLIPCLELSSGDEFTVLDDNLSRELSLNIFSMSRTTSAPCA